jgi:hypothetical protein
MNSRNAWREKSVSIRDGRGPERTAIEEPPSDWKPNPPAGFVLPQASVEPLTWDGDQG